MRVINFRVWDKAHKIMSSGMPLKWFLTGEGADLEFPKTDESLPLKDLIYYLDDYVFMQFIGVKDRKRKQIYEGDIIKWGDLPDSREDEIRIATVKIDPDIQFDCKNIRFPYVFHWGAFAYGGKQLEIVGNIYETPELLKATTDSQ